jgi:hypothetical protein
MAESTFPEESMPRNGLPVAITFLKRHLCAKFVMRKIRGVEKDEKCRPCIL